MLLIDPLTDLVLCCNTAMAICHSWVLPESGSLYAAGGVNFTMQKFGSTIQVNFPKYKNHIIKLKYLIRTFRPS